ncbi:MAG TPA: peptidoglycan DD-metalloendopeptidase family protein [Gaiellaceae bacterium]
MPIPRRIIVLLVASAAVIALAVPAALGQSLSNRKDALDAHISGLQDQIAKAKAKEQVLTGDISAASTRINGLAGDIDTLTAKVNALEHDLAVHRSRLARLEARLRDQTETLHRLVREHAEAQARLEARLVQLYETDEASELEILLQVNSLSDLLEQLDYFHTIGQEDKRIADTIKRLQGEMRVARQLTATTKAEVAQATAILAKKTEEQRAARDQLVAERSALAAARSDKQAILANVRQERHADEEDLAAMQAASAAIASKIRSGGSSGTGAPSAAGLIWPVNGPITSGFGWRWGRMHEGIDIGAACGTPIHAAASGTVVFSGWMDGYGNFVIIDHGNGLATAYGHQSAIYVSGGHVSQGQVIGAVGSTGHSTGCHLHFEVRVNGTPVNPLNYL